jgi:hypothetical protein
MTSHYYCQLCDFKFTTPDLSNNSLMLVPINKNSANLLIFCDTCLSFAQTNMHVTSNS